MINGSAIAPFRHDSTWPDHVQTNFRSAVYYLHKRVAGRGPEIYLRELILLVLREEKPQETLAQWEYLKDTCDKVLHAAIRGVSDEEMFNLVSNLLVFANLLLIRDYGLESTPSIRFETDDLAEKEKNEMGAKAARDQFMASIDRAYESLESALEKLKQRDGKPRGPLRFETGAAVISSIPGSFHILEIQDTSDVKFVIAINGTDRCEYMFYPHNPVGWVMMKGSHAKDNFADDCMSSTKLFGKQSAAN